MDRKQHILYHDRPKRTCKTRTKKYKMDFLLKIRKAKMKIVSKAKRLFLPVVDRFSRLHLNISQDINVSESLFSKLESKLPPEISLHKEVISYPLCKGESTKYSGGLISSNDYQLIDEAILRASNIARQELPMVNKNDIEKLSYLSKGTLLYGGILYNHFGHFIIESLCRLWAYHYLHQGDLLIGFHPSCGIPEYLPKDHFVN